MSSLHPLNFEEKIYCRTGFNCLINHYICWFVKVITFFNSAFCINRMAYILVFFLNVQEMNSQFTIIKDLTVTTYGIQTWLTCLIMKFNDTTGYLLASCEIHLWSDGYTLHYSPDLSLLSIPATTSFCSSLLSYVCILCPRFHCRCNSSLKKIV